MEAVLLDNLPKILEMLLETGSTALLVVIVLVLVVMYFKPHTFFQSLIVLIRKSPEFFEILNEIKTRLAQLEATIIKQDEAYKNDRVMFLNNIKQNGDYITEIKLDIRDIRVRLETVQHALRLQSKSNNYSKKNRKDTLDEQ